MANELQTKLNAILEDKDTNLKPENLKAGVSCLGVNGTLENSGIDTSDATATAEDIVSGKTAYANEQKITGTLKEILAEEANAAGNETMSNIAKVPLIKEIYTNAEGEMYVRIDYVKDTVQRAGSMLMVDAPTLATVIGLTADKIKAGETILGITGTYTG